MGELALVAEPATAFRESIAGALGALGTGACGRLELTFQVGDLALQVVIAAG